MSETTKEEVTSRCVDDEFSGFSEISLRLCVGPVSQQSSGNKKVAFREIIQGETKKFGRIIIGDVTVGITWYGNENRRYETDKDPDVDNIIKPILDSLVGVDGVFVDDCQVQHVTSTWIDTTGCDVLEIDIKYVSECVATKQGLFFVQFEGAVCMPIHYLSTTSVESVEMLTEVIAEILSKAKALEAAGHHDAAHALKPYMRLFHRTRLGGFPVVMATAVKSYLEGLSEKTASS